MDTQSYLKGYLFDHGFQLVKGVYRDPSISAASGFETAYLAVREKELRIAGIKSIRKLPYVSKNEPNAEEWKIRARSAEKLADNLKRMKQPITVLEIGCGNGWLTHFLARNLRSSTFAGLDINLTELNMAAEAFNDATNIAWIYGDIIKEDIFPQACFDIILFAASLQYFPDLKLLFNRIKQNLTAKGEIHIIDTPFYDTDQVEAARERTKNYYKSIGPEMAQFYHHHTFKELTDNGLSLLKMNKTGPNLLTKLPFAQKYFDHFPWYILKQP